MSKPISSDAAKGYATILIAIAAVVIVAIVIKKFFGGLDSFLESFGLKDNAEQKQVKEDIQTAIDSANTDTQTSPWNPQFRKLAPSGAKLRTVSDTDKAAKQIWNSSGYLLPDKPEEAFAALKTMPSQAAISFLVERFEILYKKDLLAWLNEAFNDTPTQLKVLSQMLNYVSNLPKY